MSELRERPVPPRCVEGAVSVESAPEGLRPWRLPVGQLALFPSDASDRLVGKAGELSGVRLRLATDARELELRLAPLGAPRKVDLTIDNALAATADVSAGAPPEQGGLAAARFDGLPAGRKVIELWLPHDQPATLVALAAPDGATVEPVADPRRRWITYGSSITHCRAAHSPARTWPATAARLGNLHLTSLGFGGECHLDAMVGRLIRDLPADLVTLKLGINTHGGTLGARTFRSGAIALVQIIREKHPSIPIGLISPIISPPRETQRSTASSMTLQEMRDLLCDAVDRLRGCGDLHVHYFDGRELFGAELVERYLPDQLHPNGDGYEIMGRNFSRVVLSKLGF